MASRPLVMRPLHQASHSIVTRTGNVASRAHEQMEMFGRILFFVVEVVVYIPYTLRHYRKEVWRQLGDVTFGRRMVAVAASTVVVATLITAVVGVNLGISGLQGLNILGLGPLAGALSSFGNTRSLRRYSPPSVLRPRWVAGSPPSWVPCGCPRKSTPSR